MGHLVKKIEMYLSVGSSTVPKRPESPDILCKLSSPVTEATDGGLKCLLRLMV